MTEVPGLDDLAAATGAIAESQLRTAARLGARAAYYLVQGSSGGIIALLLGAARSIGAQTVVLPRLSHTALASAVVLSGMRPLFVPVHVHRGVPCGVDAEDVDRVLSAAGPGAIVFDVYPNAFGVAHDLAAVGDAAAGHGALLLVDGAHSGLFGLHPALPPAPLKCGAAAVVVSAHKTLGSLGQSSLLLFGEHAPPELEEASAAALRLTGTTSPSYPLMLSLESAVDHVAGGDGRPRIDAAVEAALTARCELRSAGLSMPDDELPEGRCQDPLRIVIDAWELRRTGFELAAGLLRADGVQVEGADWRNVLTVFGLGDGTETALRMMRALRPVCLPREGAGPAKVGSAAPASGPDRACSRLESLYTEFAAGPWEAALEPRSAWLAPGRFVELEEACGRVAGEPIAPYPPGVPIVWPGETITGRHVEFLRTALDLGASVHGLYPPDDGETSRRVRVVGTRRGPGCS